jgi:putative FmdB family regulatory protein
MPTYEYQCESCGRRFERFQRISESPLAQCPDCGGRLDRLIGAGAGIIVKQAISVGTASSGASCGRERPCCGRETPCETKPCA